MIHRPLVLAHDVPAVMIDRRHLSSIANYLLDHRIPFVARPFQQSFELIRFPGLSTDDVERILDRLAPRIS
jgi:hypothetical protein